MEKTNFDNAGVIETTINTEDGRLDTIIWLVQHKCNNMRLNWTCAFSSLERALEHIKERVGWYESQGGIIVKDEWYNEEYGGDNEFLVNFDVLLEEGGETVIRLHIEPVYLDCRDCTSFVL